MKKSLIVILTLMAILCLAVNIKALEGSKLMNNRQPFSNPQLNSLLPYNLSAKGKLLWRLEYNPDNISGSLVSLLMIDDSRAILDYTDAFFALDTSNIKALGYSRKSHNSFIVLGEGQEFYVFAGYRLVKINFDFFQKEPEKSHFVPGLGDYSNLVLFIPKSDGYIAAIQGTGDPKYLTPTFGIYEKGYLGYNYLWKHSFIGYAIIPPASIDGNFVVAMDNSIRIIGNDGSIKKEFEGKFIPLSCSIGSDGLIYLICKAESKYIIRAMDFELNIKWECATSITKPTQPPAVSNDSKVYLVGSKKIEAFSNGEMLWKFDLTDDDSPKIASVTNDGMLLVTDGRFIKCLDNIGELVWAFRWNKEETFMTQPILDSTGKVIVATDKKILAIE